MTCRPAPLRLDCQKRVYRHHLFHKACAATPATQASTALLLPHPRSLWDANPRIRRCPVTRTAHLDIQHRAGHRTRTACLRPASPRLQGPRARWNLTSKRSCHCAHAISQKSTLREISRDMRTLQAIWMQGPLSSYTISAMDIASPAQKHRKRCSA
jgi:hypothetical protein